MFQVWGYSVGMRRLLLRSTKGEAAKTRVDVFFQNVKAMDVTTQMNGLAVFAAEGPDVKRISLTTGLVPSEDCIFYVLLSGGRRGHVVASLVAESVDDLEFHEASQYWGSSTGIA